MPNALALLQLVADPTRPGIIKILKQGERAVCEITDQVGIRQSGVSRHLRKLHAAGKVRVRADGQRRLYALRPEPFADLDDWISSDRRRWTAMLDCLAGALTALTLEKDTE